MPKTTELIASKVFSYCPNLINIYVDDANATHHDVDGVLYYTAESRLAVYPGGRESVYVVPDGTEVLGIESFYSCQNIDEVILPDSVMKVRQRAFMLSSLKKIAIPRSVTLMGPGVFASCSNLKEIYVPSTFADTESTWNSSNTPATFYDYVITYTKGDEIVDKEYVLAGGNATAPAELADIYDFADENGETWTGEKITSDAYVVLTEKKVLSNNANIASCEYSYYSADGVDNIVAIEKWEQDENGDYVYNGTVPADAKVSVTATAEDENATVEVGDIYYGEDTIKTYIDVKAEDGTVQSYYIYLTIEVPAVEIVAVSELDEIVVDYGSAFALPDTVNVELSTGDTMDVPVTWNSDVIDTTVATTYSIIGTLELPEGVTNPNDLTAYLYVTVKDKELSSNTNVTVQYSYGAEYITVEDWEVYGVENWYYATIPADTEYTKLDATPEDENTTVDITTTAGENGEEIYNIVVTAEDGTRAFYYVSLAKEVAEITVESIIELEPFVLEYGSDDELLYEAVEVVFSNGETQYVSVKWNTDEYNTYEPGEYKVSGELLLGEGYSNPNGLMAYVTVIVNEKYVPSNNTNLSSAYYSYDGKQVRIRKWAQDEEGYYYYSATVPADAQVIEITATAEDANATVQIENYEEGRKFEGCITVIAEDGTEQIYRVYIEKEIAAREIVEIPSVSDIWVTQGDSEWAMLLPEVVEVQLSDGEYVSLAVEWEGADVDYYTPNTYAITGVVAVDGVDITNPNELKAEINVIVEAIPVPDVLVISQIFIPDEISLDEGVSVEVALPETVTAMLEDGSTIDVPVVWDTTTFDYSIVNEKQIIYGDIVEDAETGITNPNILRAEVHVSIYREEPTDRIITGIRNIFDTISVPYGTDLTTLELPLDIEVDLNDGTSQYLEIKWDLADVNTEVPGMITVKGEIVTVDGIQNSYEFRASINLVIEEKPLPKVTKVLSCSDVVAYVGTEVTASALGLPTQVQLVLDDGNMLTVPVEWNIDEVTTDETGYYPLEGTLNLDGYEAENPDELKAYVNLDIFEKPEVDLSLASIKYTLNNVEYEITAADKTAETEWTVYIPEDEWTATMSISVSAEATDTANAEVVISQPTSITSAGTQAVINVTAVDSEESVAYTIYFKPKARTWNVTFMSNGETVSTQTIKDGYPAYNPGPLDGDGKEFAGWDRDFSCVTSDMTVNALYEEINDDEWSFWYIEKIDDIVVDSTMTIATLRAILPTQAWVWYRRGAETMCIPAAIEWEIPDDFFALGADTRLLVAKIITSPTGAYPIDANVNAEVNIVFAGAGESTTRYIISVSRPADVAVPYNATAAEMAAVLPKTVSVTLDNGSIQNMNVEWDLSTVILTQAGTYEIMGGIFHGTDVQNPGEHKAKMNVIVNEKLTANGALRAEEITATPGEEITVKITADENLNMAIGSFMLEFDRGMLELVDYEIGGLIGGSNPMVNESYDDNGIEKVYVSFMGLNNITAGGEVITLKLKVSENAADDAHYPVDIQNVKFYDFNENHIEVDEVDGDVHVLHYMTGDVNNNGMVELIDAFRVLRYDAGLIDFTKAEMLAADVNADVSVNILDALMIQKFDAGLITEF